MVPILRPLKGGTRLSLDKSLPSMPVPVTGTVTTISAGGRNNSTRISGTGKPIESYNETSYNEKSQRSSSGEHGSNNKNGTVTPAADARTPKESKEIRDSNNMNNNTDANHISSTRHRSHHQNTTAARRSHGDHDTMATILVGQRQQRFKVDKKLLCATSPFFRDRLETASHSRPVSLWLPGESAAMFGLFVAWVHARPAFRRHLDDVAALAIDAGDKPAQDFHWALIRLHLFASHLQLFHLQDLAMDALQDLYLRCDWDVPPGLISYLYTKCEALPAVRLRRWAVAMVAFSLTGAAAHSRFEADDAAAAPAEEDVDPAAAGDSSQFRALLDSLPEFATDYTVHLRKMRASGLDVRFKNPQLRIPANRLRNEERAFGFRECSFHSHRATVGEKRCPHHRARRVTRRPETEPGAEQARATAGAEADGCGRSSGVGSDISSAIGVSEAAKSTTMLATRLSAPSRRDADVVPRPLFSRDGPDERQREKAMAHMRSMSSILK